MDDRLQTYLRNHQQQMFTLLKKMVRINSGSHNKAGVDAVGRVVAQALADVDLTINVLENKHVGNQLLIRTPHRPVDAGQVLLVGHMDTVFPENTAFNWYREDADCSYGPGVIDMKGGLAQIVIERTIQKAAHFIAKRLVL